MPGHILQEFEMVALDSKQGMGGEEVLLMAWDRQGTGTRRKRGWCPPENCIHLII